MTKEILKSTNLKKNFGSLVAVDIKQFDVKKGEIKAIIGPNGAGKTTLFNLISGLLKPDRGKVFFNGEDITYKAPYEIVRKGLVRTFQLVQIFDELSVYGNIKLAVTGRLGAYKIWLRRTHECIDETEKILETVGLTEQKELLAKNLSHGQKRLLQLGIALALKPQLLMLDEITAGLVPSETEVVMGLLKKLNDQGITIAIIEHDFKVVFDLADTIVVMDKGDEIFEGTPEEVVRSDIVRRTYFG